MTDSLPILVGAALGIALVWAVVRPLWHAFKTADPELPEHQRGLQSSDLEDDWIEDYYQDPNAPYMNPGAFGGERRES